MLLEVKDLVVSYGKVAALHGVSLDITEGHIVAIIGANGAGKSTLLNAISGIVRYQGEITFRGSRLAREPHRVLRAGIAQVPEGRRIFPNLTVEENLLIGGYVVLSRRVLQQRMEEAYELFPVLKERRRQYGGTLSGGEQQMLAVSRGLMANPQLLLLDEPSLGLAPLVVRDLFKLFCQLNRQGTTILLVEQNARQALAIAHRAYVLETGRVVGEGTGAELLENPVIRKAYLGVKEAGEG